MAIDHNTVDRIATLAKLEFEGEAKDEMVKDLNRIIGFVEKLNELDTEGVEPLIYMTDEPTILREDEIKVEITQKEALMNAPKHDSDFFRVPKVVEKK
jgi:aspartyl-tRNA(Asn)/glutamyl-tRNA(Gln) amidotransferase subunit C